MVREDVAGIIRVGLNLSSRLVRNGKPLLKYNGTLPLKVKYKKGW